MFDRLKTFPSRAFGRLVAARMREAERTLQRLERDRRDID